MTTGTALLVNPDGTVTDVAWPPPGGTTLRRMYELLDCQTVEVVRFPGGIDMWLDEEGKFVDDHDINTPATELAWALGRIDSRDYIAGRALFTGHEGPETVTLNPTQLALLRKALTMKGARA